MDALLVALLTGGASFVGSWAAFQVHIHYLRRDVDHAHHRIDNLELRRNAK